MVKTKPWLHLLLHYTSLPSEPPFGETQGCQERNIKQWFQRADRQQLQWQQSRSRERLWFKCYVIDWFIWNPESWNLLSGFIFTVSISCFKHQSNVCTKDSLVNFTAGKHPEQGKEFVVLWKENHRGRKRKRERENETVLRLSIQRPFLYSFYEIWIDC